MVGFAEALRYWIRLGFINFGGPAGQIALMHRDIVERRRWISEGDFLRALNFCMILPGPEAQQLATYLGWRLHGIAGGIVAGVWFVLPSVLVLLGLSWLLAEHRDVTVVAGLLYGVQPVVVAIVAEAVLRVGRRTLTHWGLALFAAGAFVLLRFLGIPFPLIVAGAGVLGLLLARRWPGIFRAAGHAADGAESAAAAFPRQGRLWRVLAVFVVLWTVPVALLVAALGRSSTHADMALFFTGAAFVTFGGAYAVLAFIADVAVNVYGWLAPGEMVQGLALAESTPGPLIMVTQYVGFMGAWRSPGSLDPFWSAALASAVVTYVTFLPSFMFIFAGAPYVEALAGDRRLQAALVGVTAAVVGVILNLAVFFAAHVLFIEGVPDLYGIVISVLAFVALQRLRWGVPVVILIGAVAGLAATLVVG